MGSYETQLIWSAANQPSTKGVKKKTHANIKSHPVLWEIIQKLFFLAWGFHILELKKKKFRDPWGFHGAQGPFGFKRAIFEKIPIKFYIFCFLRCFYTSKQRRSSYKCFKRKLDSQKLSKRLFKSFKNSDLCQKTQVFQLKSLVKLILMLQKGSNMAQSDPKMVSSVINKNKHLF